MQFFFGLPRFATDVPYPRKRSEYPDLWLYEHLSTSNVIFLFLNILLMVTPGGGDFPAFHPLRTIIHHPRSLSVHPTIFSEKNSMIKYSHVHMRFLRYDGQTMSLGTEEC